MAYHNGKKSKSYFGYILTSEKKTDFIIRKQLSFKYSY